MSGVEIKDKKIGEIEENDVFFMKRLSYYINGAQQCVSFMQGSALDSNSSFQELLSRVEDLQEKMLSLTPKAQEETQESQQKTKKSLDEEQETPKPAKSQKQSKEETQKLPKNDQNPPKLSSTLSHFTKG